MNIQPIEKREHRVDGLLAVHSIFLTIQGEGPFCGTPCVFLRLAGCNLQCPACDTDYTSSRRMVHASDLVEQICDAHTVPGRKLVVITGGEPFRQDLRLLFKLLVAAGFYVQVETNGTLEPAIVGFSAEAGWSYNRTPHQRKGVYVICSPKTGKLHPNIYKVACALKYVVRAGMADPEDGLPLHALDHVARPARPPAGWDRPIYIQPLDSQDERENARHTATAVDLSMRYGYVLQLQIHKLIGVE